MPKYKITGKMLRPYQLEIVKQLMNGDKQHFIGALPRGGGKSVLAFWQANALICKNYPNITHVLILAKEKAQVKEIYQKNLLSGGKPLIDIIPSTAKYIPYQSEVVYANGSTIKFHGADDVDNIRGGRYDLIICDEMATWKPNTLDVIIPCLRDSMKSMLFIISTVRGKNEFYKLMERYKNNPRWIVLKETVFSLGIMTQEQYDGYPMEENMKRQELLNDVDSAFVGSIYAKPNIDTNLFVRGLPVYGAVDLGKMDDATAFTLCQIVDGKVNIFATLEFYQVYVGEIIGEIFSLFDKLNINKRDFILFTPHDGNVRSELDGRTRQDLFKQQGITCRNVPFKGIMDGIHLVRSVWHDIIFDSTCEVGIERIKSYAGDDNGRPLDGRENHRQSHVPDSLRYLVLGLENMNLIKTWKDKKDNANRFIGMDTYTYENNVYTGVDNYWETI